MAKFEFKLPDIGEGVTEGEIVGWLVSVGDSVTEDQEMVEVMTDKATVTIGAPKAGKVMELRGNVGDVVPVGDVLVVFDTEGGNGAAASAEAPGAAEPSPAASKPKEAAKPAAGGGAETRSSSAATAVGDIKEDLPGMSQAQARASSHAAEGFYSEKPLAAPATRKLARELGIDLRRVEPTGSGGRVTREDVERHGQGQPVAPAARASAQAPAPAPAQPPAPVPTPSSAEDQRVPIRGLRKRIYENMARSVHTQAHFSYVDECQVGELMAVRKRVQKYGERDGVKLSFLPFIVKAAVAALKRHPYVNCLVDDASQEMVLKASYDIGIAVATDAGLTVPVLREADRKSILEIAKEIERLAEDARAGKLGRQDLGNSSFTVSSLGKLGGMFAPPIVNYPEVAIMGVHAIKQRPIVRNNEIVVGDVMLLSFTFDHRIIDGHMGAAFAQEIIGLLEEPDRLLVEMA